MLTQDQVSIIRAHQKAIPVCVITLADALGVPVYYADEWEDDLSGMIIKDKKNQYQSSSNYAIFVNKSHSEARQRFTIAHELAHFLLHKDKIGDGISDDALYRSVLSNKIEVVANKLAANILMPWDLVTNAMQDGVETLEELSKLFRVSKSAMAIRLGVPYDD